eukprot:1160125-Pelagomonas_calceolata.AAC.8
MLAAAAAAAAAVPGAACTAAGMQAPGGVTTPCEEKDWREGGPAAEAVGDRTGCEAAQGRSLRFRCCPRAERRMWKRRWWGGGDEVVSGGTEVKGAAAAAAAAGPGRGRRWRTPDVRWS